MEDFLDPNALSINIDGKTFSSANTYDPKKYFGKIELSKHIVANTANYSFSKFGAILDRLAGAIENS